MNFRNNWQAGGGQKGTVILIVAISLVVLVGIAALAIDVGHLLTTRSELQNVADAAALAGARYLGVVYSNLSTTEMSNHLFTFDEIYSVVEAVAIKNDAARVAISIREDDVLIGRWHEGYDDIFDTTLVSPDAVRVIARRDTKKNSPISTFLAKALKINTLEVTSRKAIAALTGQSTTEPGELELPVGISSYFFLDGNFCNDSIVFSPTNDPAACAGWNSYDLSPPNDNLLRQILDSEVLSPGTAAGETEFNFIGGNLSNPTFDAMLLLFMRKGYDIDANGDPVLTDEFGNPVPGHLGDAYPGTVPMTYDDGSRAYYPDSNQNPTPRNLHRWETTVAVYSWETCANPNTTIPIVGYSKIIMTDVQDAPEKRIVGQVLCDVFSNESTRGGGGSFGLKGTIPGLVQ